MKYIIELEDEPFGRNDDPKIPHGMDELWRVKGFNSLVFDKNGLMRLEPLENVMAGIEAKAYQRGYEAGLAEGRRQAEDSCEGCANAEKPISALLCMTCRRRYPDKYQQAVEPDDEIRVGDEVIAAFTDKSGTAVVTRVNNKKEAWYIYADGSIGYDDFSNLDKTGRHFPEVEKLLEVMKE